MGTESPPGVELDRIIVASHSNKGAHVQADHDDLARIFGRHLLKPGHFGVAWCAGARPEVQDHRLSLLEDLVKACLFATQHRLALVGHDAKVSAGTGLSAVARCGMQPLDRQDGKGNHDTDTRGVATLHPFRPDAGAAGQVLGVGDCELIRQP